MHNLVLKIKDSKDFKLRDGIGIGIRAIGIGMGLEKIKSATCRCRCGSLYKILFFSEQKASDLTMDLEQERSRIGNSPSSKLAVMSSPSEADM